MKRFFRRAAVWLARLAAIFLVLLILFYAEEDWRGARDWAACQRDLAAKGESLDLRQLAPPGQPEDDLSKVPIFAELYRRPPVRFEDLLSKDTRKPTRFDHISIYLGCEDYDKQPKNSSYLKGQSIDLTVWQKFYRSLPASHLPDAVGTPAQDVLQALSQFDPEWTEVETALNNPKAYWPIDYEEPFQESLGGITSMIRMAKVLPLKAVAHLENHEPDLAEKDYLFSFRLNQPLTRGCGMVSYLVMVGVRVMDDAILWEGLHRHVWNDAQLHEMEFALASTDMVATGVNCFRTERASALQTIKFTQINEPRLLHGGVVSSQAIGIFRLLRIRPNGWWDQDKRSYSLGVQRAIDSVDLSAAIFDPPQTGPKWEYPSKNILRQIYLPLTTSVLPVFDNFEEKVAHAETSSRLARLACRLEEYRIAHAQYPDTLDALPDLPAHLNQEVLSEQPLRYQRKGDGYLLYSIGWNQKDDGGTRATDDKEGDWVWPSP